MTEMVDAHTEPYIVVSGSDGSVELRRHQVGVLTVLKWLLPIAAIATLVLYEIEWLTPPGIIVAWFAVCILVAIEYSRYRQIPEWQFDARERVIRRGEQDTWDFEDVDGVYYYHNRYVEGTNAPEEFDERFEVYIKLNGVRYLVTWFSTLLAANALCELLSTTISRPPASPDS